MGLIGDKMIKNLTPRLAEMGKIKIGGKGQKRKTNSGGEFWLPVKHDHFTITKVARDNDGNFIKDTETMELIGNATNQPPNKLTRLPIRFLYDSPDLIFPTSYACYHGMKCWCRGDGVAALREGQSVQCPCERQAIDYQSKDKCKANGVLSVVLDGVNVVGGVWRFRTTSYNSVSNILASLAFIHHITGGKIANIPLEMVLEPKTASIPGSGKPTTVYVVRLEYKGTVDRLMQIGIKEAERRAIGHIKMQDIEKQAKRIPYIVDPVDDEAEIAKEFYPDTVAGDSVSDMNEALNTDPDETVNTETGEITQEEENPAPEDPVIESGDDKEEAYDVSSLLSQISKIQNDQEIKGWRAAYKEHVNALPKEKAAIVWAAVNDRLAELKKPAEDEEKEQEPQALTKPCPQKNGNPVDEDECHQCGLRVGCPSWEERDAELEKVLTCNIEEEASS
jgi:hypothetical protein